MRPRRPSQLVALLFALGLLCANGLARAVPDFTFNLDTGNSAISGFTGPYATVTVHWVDATDATITFQSLTGGGNIFLLGDGGSVAVNVNATSWTLSNIAGSNSGTGFTPGPFSNGGAGNEDGFGSFNQTINSFDGFTHSSDTISFDLKNTGGTWLDAISVLAANANNAIAAAHIFVTTFPANASNGALATGFAASNGGGGPPVTIPEPQSLALLGIGLIALGLTRRQRK